MPAPHPHAPSCGACLAPEDCKRLQRWRVVPRVVCSKRGQNVHFRWSDLGARLALEAERRPPTFLRRPHGRHACACGRQLGAALRPRARAAFEAQTCAAPSIHRPRWCAGRCAARGRPQWLQSFGTILAALGRSLQLAPSANQVLLTHLTRATHPPRSLTSGCTTQVAGDHLTLP